ncbi:MAG: helix-turn-helix transcriptional regulator [Bacillota bacterium]|nr:helix-turn-helix transcriptional regulator [Bacillota bacterium]
MKLGDKIKNLRTEHNMTQPDLAKELDVTVRTIAYYENNERQPKKTLIVKLCKLFNVSIDYLLTDDESFLVDAEDEYGYRGKKKAEEFIRDSNTLFAGGELNDEDRDKVFKAITEIYWKSKEKNKKYTPKKYRK